MVISCLFVAWTEVFKLMLQIIEGTDDNTDFGQLFRTQYNSSLADLGILPEHGIKLYEKNRVSLHFSTMFRKKISNHIRYNMEKRNFKIPNQLTNLQFVDIVARNAF